jgi:translation elongation factor EF-Ts
VRDNKTPVSGIIKEASAKAGGEVTVVRFARYTLGE